MQTYLDLPEGTPIHSPQFEYEEKSMQVPFGRFSILSELWHGHVTAAESVVFLSLNHRSIWDPGLTWYIATRELARSLDMKLRYCRWVLENLKQKDWIVPLQQQKNGRRYKLVHHNCDTEEVPVGKDGKPLKFAVPFGTGGPFERLEAGDISWKACLLWIIHKRHSDWNTGITDPSTLTLLAKFCKMKRNTICNLHKELESADMIRRLSAPKQKSVFQLYPMPHPKPKKTQRKFIKVRDVPTDGIHWYSDNRQYRRNRETLLIERRRGKGKWSPISDDERYNEMPQAILRDFEKVAEIRSMFLDRLADENQNAT